MNSRQISSFSLFLWMLVVLGAACTRKSPGPTLAPLAEEEVTRIPGHEFTNSLPRVGGPAGYTGSESCRECHRDQFASWHRSYHRTMTQFATTNSMQANFHNVVLTNDNTRFTLREEQGEYWVRMEHLNAAFAEPLEVRVAMITGSHHMQVFWVGEGHGNMQIGFPFTWLIPEKRWVPRNSTFIRPPDLPHRPEVWNIVCSRCHTTGVEPHADMAARRIETQVAELGISCEACHGPGQRHVETQQAAAVAGALRGVTAEEIVHPEKLDPVRASQVCGFCHSMKWIPESENWREGGFAFRPGDDLEKTTPIIRPKHVSGIDGLVAYLNRNPDLLNDFFWPDGMIRVSGREYNGLIESPCYKGGKFSCLSCHSLHDSEPDDQLARHATINGGNGACLQCHGQYREPAALAAHTRHSAGSVGSECYNCHMPHTTYGVLKAIRSHEISSPRVADELASGRANACNLCHMDKPLGWTARHLEDWYGQSKVPQPVSTNHASGMVAALTGDAGQRVIVAWHLGWEPALIASGRGWPAAVLGQLLDDPYAAVRCVAERSMRQAFPELLPSGYDYTIDPRTRPSARAAVWQKWSSSAVEALPEGTAKLLTPAKLADQAAAFEGLLERRNDRPMRLRE